MKKTVRSSHFRTSIYGRIFHVREHLLTKHGHQKLVSVTIPNAKCPVCGQEVFYYENSFGSKVYFDEIGPSWPKHPCTDTSNPPRLKSTSMGAEKISAWQKNGWTHLESFKILNNTNEWILASYTSSTLEEHAVVFRSEIENWQATSPIFYNSGKNIIEFWNLAENAKHTQHLQYHSYSDYDAFIPIIITDIHFNKKSKISFLNIEESGSEKPSTIVLNKVEGGRVSRPRKSRILRIDNSHALIKFEFRSGRTEYHLCHHYTDENHEKTNK